MHHTWHRNTCPKCLVRREPLPPAEKPAGDVSPYRYFLPDAHGEYGKRPPCAGRGESRHSRRAGRRTKLLAASRAGGPRRLSREATARLARQGATATAAPEPMSGPDPSPIAS